MRESRRLRANLPFRRVALVLSGGGALGAYEVGVLRALETLGLRPAILAGVSVGAINAAIWLAHGFRTASLERLWAKLRSSSVGLRWLTLMMRAAGAFVVVLALVQVVLTLAGSRTLSPASLVRRDAGSTDLTAALLDVAAWLVVAFVGQMIVRGSRGAEDWLARLSPPRDPHRLHRGFGIALAVAGALHLVVWAFGMVWPYRFSAILLLMGAVIWFANRPGVAGDRLRRLFLQLLPETSGRGLWGSDARRRLIREGVAGGDPGALVGGETHLIVYACAIETGRMSYFINWPDPTPAFRAGIHAGVGEVETLGDPDAVVEAVVASSAIPAVFEPVRIGAREYVDGGVFASQPLDAVMADGADAMIVVLVSPSGSPPRPRPEPNLLELAGRLLEIAWWRDLQGGLRRLPAEWSAESSGMGPRRACVVEPDETLPGGLYGFSPTQSAELRRRGEADAWRALEAAGWLEAG
ncbi:MAG: patatin-like phospholipase family protein [Candidatus Eisenbacteria bacterium]|uniref:Patatin-like phospholipase family protein n=1 Tax=Eiseniibacteriota bacterium TaxID=2212470 RepID=A0A9D6QJU1_UNCEI|nr:patatin-like phospholipase family protein [Candidatus Eisenbacteria bacterium]MBI3539511.1 patatin-like phospholipase family protein [Candidatus Eisenbacteria bacterium]